MKRARDDSSAAGATGQEGSRPGEGSEWWANEPKQHFHNALQKMGRTGGSGELWTIAAVKGGGFECRIADDPVLGTLVCVGRSKKDATDKVALAGCRLLHTRGFLHHDHGKVMGGKKKKKAQSSGGGGVAAGGAGGGGGGDSGGGKASRPSTASAPRPAVHPFCLPFSQPLMNGAHAAKKGSSKLIGDGGVLRLQLRDDALEALSSSLGTAWGKQAAEHFRTSPPKPYDDLRAALLPRLVPLAPYRPAVAPGEASAAASGESAAEPEAASPRRSAAMQPVLVSAAQAQWRRRQLPITFSRDGGGDVGGDGGLVGGGLRSRLPVFARRDEVLAALGGGGGGGAPSVVVLGGETGSGKSTQVPQLIADGLLERLAGGAAGGAAAGEESCLALPAEILVTQPRRVAAISVASRVAVERGEELGDSVGYTVRLESTPPKVSHKRSACT